MTLPINIETLLSGDAIEGNRLEYKEGWNPDAIYRTICAFANDFDDTGGGYIVVGVKELNGRAIRPVLGVNPESVERIEKEMVQMNNMFQPYYQPRLYVEHADGKTILIIKAMAGERRPYKIPDCVTAKHKTFNYYIRYNSSSIIPKNEYEIELINLANKVPFDDRGNANISLSDISSELLRDYLVEVKSSLADQELSSENLKRVLEQMDLLEHTVDGWRIRNVAAMMFCKQPQRFFKQMQVDIVIFPEGRERNPNALMEIPSICGPVPHIIHETLTYLRTNIIREHVAKPKLDARSIRFFNYPYQALEEAVVNALFHRDYTQREPVEITIEPDRISILSFSGPDRTISMEAIREGRALRSRRYRNRRLGEFLKELNLTEGRSTGIPTIQEELANNGSAPATIETDEARSYFLMDIPCHSAFSMHEILAGISGLSKSEDGKLFNNESFKELLSKSCPSLVQVLSKSDGSMIYDILQYCNTPISSRDLTAAHGNISHKQMQRLYVKPLLAANLISLTIPDKPTSSKQKYVLTEMGRDIIAEWGKAQK